jgi:myo-inositol 2-dehydrogenase/D-chiro-inositol 1-dehydrogenase
MADPVRFGVVGSGFMGQTWARVIARHVPEATLVAVAGGRGAVELAEVHGVEVLATEVLFARTDIDAVVIATPVPTHRPLVEAAVGAGKHALVEKPMTRTRADADAMVAAADAAGVRLAVVSQHRYRGAPMAARALIEAGRIGTIRMIRIFGPNAGWDIPATAWASDRSQVSPYMDWGAHACDVVRWLTGVEATRVYAQFATYTDIPPADQSSMALYTLDDGTLVTIWLTYELPPPSLGSAMQVLITGSDGVIEFDAYGTVRIATPDGGWETAFEQPPFDPLDADDAVRLQAYASQLGDLIDAIRSGRDPQVSGRQGAATTSWLEAAERSAATGEAVAIDVEAIDPGRPTHAT